MSYDTWEKAIETASAAGTELGRTIAAWGDDLHQGYAERMIHEAASAYKEAARAALEQHEAAPAGPVVSVTARYLLDRCLWDRACDMLGLNQWVINEGLMDSGDKVTFTLEQAQELGIA